MATPTNKPTNANLHNAATPQPHLAFSSPAPRSVPSPAAQRHPAGKSPFNASTHAPSSSTTAAHNHPTGGSSASATKALLGSSPAGMFSFDSPNPMTMSLSNMGGLESIGMGISMSGISGLGMGLSMTSRGNEQERTKRLEEVIHILKTRPGRVSPDGLKLMAQQTGMISELTIKRDGTSICTIAGGSVLVDVSFNAKHRVKNVEVSYPTSSQAVKDGEESASKILLDSLSVPPGGSEINLTLSKFAANLDKLAQLDKLNGPAIEQTFNCFEAISGIYISLKKLYEHEKKVAKGLLKVNDDINDIAEREVMCKKSGRPAMNTRNEIGLKLDYWMQRRHVRSKYRKQTDPEGDHDMDNEPPVTESENEKNQGLQKSNIFSLSIECEASVPEMYPPARISDAWISDQIEKPAGDLDPAFGHILDWLEPPPTYLTKTNDTDPSNIALSTMDKLPSIRFVAKLHPPLLLPLQTAVSVLGSVGMQQDTIIGTDHIGTFDALLLHPNDTDAATAAISPHVLKNQSHKERTVLLAEGTSAEACAKHSNSLFVPKPEFARYVREIPFEHPRQLVQLLPVLRQYAFLASLLSHSFAHEDPSPTCTADLADSHAVDVKLSASSKLSVLFPPLRNEDRIASPAVPNVTSGVKNLTLEKVLGNGVAKNATSITVEILLNADIAILDQNLNSHHKQTLGAHTSLSDSGLNENEGSTVTRKLAKALDVCGDIGVWVEWIRTKFAQ